MKVIAIIALLLYSITIFGGPFMIGKKRDSMTPLIYVTNIIINVPLLLLAMHVFGWV